MINFCKCLIKEIHDLCILIKIQKMINSLNKLIYMCVQRFVLNNILTSQLGPPKPKFLAPPLVTSPICDSIIAQCPHLILLSHIISPTKSKSILYCPKFLINSIKKDQRPRLKEHPHNKLQIIACNTNSFSLLNIQALQNLSLSLSLSLRITENPRLVEKQQVCWF